jgi:hypothetical protein
MLELVMAESVGQIGGTAAGALPIIDAIINATHRRGTTSPASSCVKRPKLMARSSNSKAHAESGERSA